VTTINKTFFAYFMYVILGEYVLRMGRIGGHTYEKFISPRRVKRILNKNDCQVVNYGGSFYWPWFWRPSGKYFDFFSMIANYWMHGVKK
jgi:2-polyprenyl-3-methyl-5-hydroxy-6-metoxy-1,4-benzoquinol methylase